MTTPPRIFSDRVEAGTFQTPDRAGTPGSAMHTLWSLAEQRKATEIIRAQQEQIQALRAALERIAEIPSSGFARQTAKAALEAWPSHKDC